MSKFKQFFADFKAFAMKGNVLDMAVGVVVGGAFSKIVSSLVADIITPLIALLTGDVALADLKWVISPAVIEAGVEVKPEAALMYGNFLQTVLDFLIIAFSIFCVLRLMMNAQKRFEALTKKKQAEEEAEEDAAEEAAADTAEAQLALLQEIRDLLKESKQTKDETTEC